MFLKLNRRRLTQKQHLISLEIFSYKNYSSDSSVRYGILIPLPLYRFGKVVLFGKSCEFSLLKHMNYTEFILVDWKWTSFIRDNKEGGCNRDGKAGTSIERGIFKIWSSQVNSFLFEPYDNSDVNFFQLRRTIYSIIEHVIGLALSSLIDMFKLVVDMSWIFTWTTWRGSRGSWRIDNDCVDSWS